MEYITLKERTGLKRFGIRTEDGKDTGEYIEIDLEDLELPIKANTCQLKHIANYDRLKARLNEINQKEDTKGDGELISSNQKETLEAYHEFYIAEEKALDEFLGEGATKKLLNGSKPYITMYDDINEYLEQIVPSLKDTQKTLEEKIKAKYGAKKEENIL